MKKLVLFLVVLLCVLCMVAGENASPDYVLAGSIEPVSCGLPDNDSLSADSVWSVADGVRHQVGRLCEAVIAIVGDCLHAVMCEFGMM